MSPPGSCGFRERSAAGDGNAARGGGDVVAVGRYGGTVDVDAAGHAVSAHIGQIPVDWRREEHIGTVGDFGGLHVATGDIIDVKRHCQCCIGTVVAQIEVCLD